VLPKVVHSSPILDSLDEELQAACQAQCLPSTYPKGTAEATSGAFSTFSGLVAGFQGNFM
jgi:hypothetical protein